MPCAVSPSRPHLLLGNHFYGMEPTSGIGAGDVNKNLWSIIPDIVLNEDRLPTLN